MRKIILTLLFLFCTQNVAAQPRNSNRHPQAQQPANQPSPTPVDNRQAEIDNAAKAERERYEKERNAKEDAFRDEQARQNRTISDATFWMAVFAALNLLVAGVYSFFAYRTLKAVDKEATHAGEQVTKMGEGIIQTRDLIAQNAEMATTVQGQLTVMQDTLRHDKEVFEKTIERGMEESMNTLKQLHLMELQANISKTQMEIAAEAAKTTQEQLEEMVRQNKRLEEGDARERARTDPRLQITHVKVSSLQPEKEPIFMVSIKNVGATDAVGVMIDLRVSFGRPVESTLAQKLSKPQTVSIPSGQEQTYVIPWDQPVKQKHIDRLNKVPLIVSGFIKLSGEKEREFCYRYYPLRGERPLGVPEFVPCDFDTRLTRVVTPGTARLTAEAAITTKGEVVPAKTETQNKEGAENPN